jgi:hypothetical protein
MTSLTRPSYLSKVPEPVVALVPARGKTLVARGANSYSPVLTGEAIA